MSFITYKQADSRWGKLSYNGSSSMATAGCGPTSCAMLAYGVDGKTTPLDTMRFMQKNGYAIRNNGTAWNGIPACLKAFGLTDVQEVNVNSSMSKVWELMSKGYVGVFLFRSGSKGGITWTTSGHYVAVTDYKVENGKHYLYTRDSGGRNHTGWYCYETQMKGLIPKVWCGYVKFISEVIPDYPTVTLKNGATGTQVKSLQKCLNNLINAGLTVDGNFGAKTDAAVKAFQKKYGLAEDGIVGQKTIAMLKNPVIPVQSPIYTTGVKGRRVLKTLNAVTTLELMSSYLVQSLAVKSSEERFVGYSKKDFSTQMIKMYTGGDKTEKIGRFNTFGHLNGMAYKDGKIYCCTYYGNSKLKRMAVVDVSTMKKTREFQAPVALSSVGYADGHFIGCKGSNVYIFDGNFKLQKKWKLKYTDGTNQDICAYQGQVYCCRSHITKTISTIDVYDFDGNYVHSLTVPKYELESCDFDENGTLHYATWNVPRLIKTDYTK